jgi:hypothetical protein
VGKVDNIIAPSSRDEVLNTPLVDPALDKKKKKHKY